MSPSEEHAPTTVGGTAVNAPTYDNRMTALLVVDPYNDFISEGGKIWPRIKARGRSEQLRSQHARGLKCRAAGQAARVLRHASPLPSWRLGDMDVYRAHTDRCLSLIVLRPPNLTR